MKSKSRASIYAVLSVLLGSVTANATSPGPIIELQPTATTGSVEEILERAVQIHTPNLLVVFQVERTIRQGSVWVAMSGEDIAGRIHSTPDSRVPFRLGLSLAPGFYVESTLVWMQDDQMDIPRGEWHESYFEVDKTGAARVLSAREYDKATQMTEPCPGNTKEVCAVAVIDSYEVPAPASYAQALAVDGGKR